MLDTLAVNDDLRARFAKERIYLMGRSGGSFIGIQAAARAPERFHACIGVRQMSYQLTSELLAHESLLQQYSERGNRAMVRKLQAGPLFEEPERFRAVLRDDVLRGSTPWRTRTPIRSRSARVERNGVRGNLQAHRVYAGRCRSGRVPGKRRPP